KLLKSSIKGLDERLKHDSLDEERWIVKSFVEANNIIFDNNKLISPPQDSKIDQIYEDCHFQIKKILYPDDYKPKLEDKKYRKKLEEVEDMKDFLDATVLETNFNGKYQKLDYLEQKIAKEALMWAKSGRYPPPIRSKLDLLFYLEVDDIKSENRLQGIVFDKDKFSDLMESGWRSISYLFGALSLVLYVSDEAPSFLKNIYNSQS
ncbi:TPA: hypothetical protein U0P94_002021, partial [Legionella pneumophila]|nr:hypothetical protein [Legionella pneumophila]